jgi:hypothetical protein
VSAAERAYAEACVQGLPERIADPSALATIARLLANASSTVEAGDRQDAA